jgi:uncharacterized protein with NRDE domain
MCLLVIAFRAHPRYRLVVAANRDEFHERPAAPLGKWGAPDILAGRDLRAGGTWLALDRARRFGVVTNFRDMQPPLPGSLSRGALIPAFLAQSGTAAEFLDALTPVAATYSGFNLLLCDAEGLLYASNRATPFARSLAPGIYGLSNHLLDTPWPKLTRVRREFAAWIAAPAASEEQLLSMLADRTPAPPARDAELGGLAPEWERALSAPFVLHPKYGTRCSTIVLVGDAGELSVWERRFDPQGELSGESHAELAPDEWL